MTLPTAAFGIAARGLKTGGPAGHPLATRARAYAPCGRWTRHDERAPLVFDDAAATSVDSASHVLDGDVEKFPLNKVGTWDHRNNPTDTLGQGHYYFSGVCARVIERQQRVADHATNLFLVDVVRSHTSITFTPVSAKISFAI